MTTLDRAKEISGYLVVGFPDLGLAPWSLKGACAGAGNSWQENSCLPVTKGAKDHGSDGGWQWRLDRLVDMRTWCDTHFGDWKTLKAQCAFLMHEMQRDYKALDAELKAGTKSIATMTTNFNRVFERSADNEEINNRRIKYANATYAAMLGAPNPKPPVIIGAGGGVAGLTAAIWQFVTSSPIAEVSFATNIVLIILVGYLAWELFRQGKTNIDNIDAAHQEPPGNHEASLEEMIEQYEKGLTDMGSLKADIAKKLATLQPAIDKAKGVATP